MSTTLLEEPELHLVRLAPIEPAIPCVKCGAELIAPADEETREALLDSLEGETYFYQDREVVCLECYEPDSWDRIDERSASH